MSPCRDQAAFAVYYEERRYGDTRLEPQTPGLRAQQNGFKRETLSALDDLRAELRFIVKEAGRADTLANPNDAMDAMGYGTTARVAMDSYMRVSSIPSE